MPLLQSRDKIEAEVSVKKFGIVNKRGKILANFSGKKTQNNNLKAKRSYKWTWKSLNEKKKQNMKLTP